MNTTRIKYLDIDECPGNVLNEMLVVGIIGIGLPFGVWWLGCLLFDWLGWEALYKVFHLAGFFVALFFGLGITYGAKTSMASARFGAFFLDATVAALFFWIVRGEFWTLWTPVAISGLAIHLVGKAPAVEAARKEKDRQESEKGLEEMAESLVAKGIDPEEVRKAVEELKSDANGNENVSGAGRTMRLMMKFQKELTAAAEKERLEEEKKEAERAAREKAERAAREKAERAARAAAPAAAEEEERRRQKEEEGRERESVSDWASRLAEQPEEAEDFHGWSDFSPEDWIFLLPKQPQFANKCRWGDLPEDAADRIVARCPKLRRYKVWDETYEDEEGNTQTYHHDDAAAERGISALCDTNFWKMLSARQETESNDGGGDF